MSHKIAITVQAIDKATATLKSVSGEVGNLGDKADSTSRDLQPLGTGLAAIGAAGAAVIGVATMTAARVEVLGTVLYTVGDNAGYTKGQLDAFEASLVANGITVGASRQGLIQMMQSSLDLADATDLARLAQDAAVIANKNSSEAYTDLMTVIQTGRSVMAKSLGLVVDFQGAYKRMADQLGKSAKDLTEAEKMQARLNEVMAAGEEISGVYEAAMGDVGKKLGSLKGDFEDAANALGKNYLPEAEAVVDITRDMLQAFVDLAPEQQEGIANFLAITTATAGFTGGLILLLPKIAAAKTAIIALNMTMLGPVGLVAAGLAAVYAITQLPVPIEATEQATIAFAEASIYLDGTIGSLSRTEKDLQRQLDATRVATSELTDGWMASHPELRTARTLTDGWSVSLFDAEGNIRELTDAVDDGTGAVSDYSTELDILQGAIQGPVKKANEDLLSQQEKLNQKIAEGEAELADLQSRHGRVYGSTQELTVAEWKQAQAVEHLGEMHAVLAENTDPGKQLEIAAAIAEAEIAVGKSDEAVRRASGGITDYSEDILGVQEDLAGWRGELEQLAGQHEDTINRILHGMILQQLELDGMTEAEMQYALDSARELGLVDEAYYDLATGIIDSFARAREEGHLPAIEDLIAIKDQTTDTHSEMEIAYISSQETYREELRMTMELGLQPMGSEMKENIILVGDMERATEGVGTNMSAEFYKAHPGLDSVLVRVGGIVGFLDGIRPSYAINIHTTYTETGIPPVLGPPAPTPSPPASTPPTGGGPPEGYQYGTPYVPYAGYAYLHEGEAVLTREENRRRGEDGGVTIINHFGRNSVRTDEDIRLIIEEIQGSLELQGLRDRIT